MHQYTSPKQSYNDNNSHQYASSNNSYQHNDRAFNELQNDLKEKSEMKCDEINDLQIQLEKLQTQLTKINKENGYLKKELNKSNNHNNHKELKIADTDNDDEQKSNILKGKGVNVIYNIYWYICFPFF